jgi:hypothetical protein
MSLETTAEGGDGPPKAPVFPAPVATHKAETAERANRAAEAAESEICAMREVERTSRATEAAEAEIRAAEAADRASRAREAAEAEIRAAEAADRASRAREAAEAEIRAVEAAERASRAREAAEAEIRAAEAAERASRATETAETTRPRPKDREPAAAPVVRLTVVEDGQLPRQYIVDSGRVVLGRGKCDIKVCDLEVSREHCAIDTRDGVAILRDLKSANGTVVNGRLINEHALKDGDRITIGTTVVEISVAKAA